MSKRHQNNRRKSYGRRQHELQERRQRDHVPSELDLELDDMAPASLVDRLGFMDPRTPPMHFALGD